MASRDTRPSRTEDDSNQSSSSGLAALVGLGGVALGAALFAGVSFLKSEVEKAEKEEALEHVCRQRSGNNEKKGNVPEAIRCVVCLGAEREVILLDCGHVCVCASCGGELLRTRPKCPVCRKPISNVLPAYMS